MVTNSAPGGVGVGLGAAAGMGGEGGRLLREWVGGSREQLSKEWAGEGQGVGGGGAKGGDQSGSARTTKSRVAAVAFWAARAACRWKGEVAVEGVSEGKGLGV